MTEEIEQEKPEEEEDLTCPECGKGFQDMRGLTSHARHNHGIDRDELIKVLKNESSFGFWEIFGGVGTFILVILTAGKLND